MKYKELYEGILDDELKDLEATPEDIKKVSGSITNLTKTIADKTKLRKAIDKVKEAFRKKQQKKLDKDLPPIKPTTAKSLPKIAPKKEEPKKKEKEPEPDIVDKPLNKMNFRQLMAWKKEMTKKRDAAKKKIKGKGGKEEMDSAGNVKDLEDELKDIEKEEKKPKRQREKSDYEAMTKKKEPSKEPEKKAEKEPEKGRPAPKASSGVRKRAEEIAKKVGKAGDEKTIMGILKKWIRYADRK